MGNARTFDLPWRESWKEMVDYVSIKARRWKGPSRRRVKLYRSLLIIKQSFHRVQWKMYL